MSTIVEYRLAIARLVPGTLPLGEVEQDYAINLAVNTFSKNVSYKKVSDVSGAGTDIYDILTGLENWLAGFSTITKIEYPYSDAYISPELFTGDDYFIQETPTGDILRFNTVSPQTDEIFRIHYTGFHIIDTDESTIPIYYEKALELLSAAFFCDMLATYFAQNQDSTISADSVDHTSKSREYAARAISYKKLYYSYVGMSLKTSQKAASAVGDWDIETKWGGDRLIFKNEYR